MVQKLEAPSSEAELYLARGEEVSPKRPLLTGDVFGEIEIPGLEDSEGDVIILSHPCSMRRGVDLINRLLVVRVRSCDSIPLSGWSTGYFRQMPLPDLYGDSSHASAYFEEMGLVLSAHIQAARRVACLSRKGINLLQQRFIWYLTRFAVPTFQLDRVAAAAFEEADLQEDWVTMSIAQGRNLNEARCEFEEWIRSPSVSGVVRQKLLAEPQNLAGVRREMQSDLRRRFGP